MSLNLLDYRRQVFSHYSEVRSSIESAEAHASRFRAHRDDLFRMHSQSPLSPNQKSSFSGLDYFDYDPKWRKTAKLNYDVKQNEFLIKLRGDGDFKMKRIAYAHFMHDNQELRLSLFWVLGYGGGLFLPFRDESRKSGETYGGSRYLLDTIKGADLGGKGSSLNLDFNYAYNPSCAYNDSWDCPLAPQENWLNIPVFVGEKAFPPAQTN